VIAAFFTSFYSWRLMFMTFHGKARASRDVMNHVHESPQVMLIPLYVLAVGALLAGILFKEYFVGHDEALFWGTSLYRSPENNIVEEFHNVPAWVVWSPFVAMVLGFAVSWLFYIRRPDLPGKLAEQHHAGLPVPAQQVVHRRAVRPDLRAPGEVAGPLLLEKG
jgi:NADH-quinone oxidoreductase subunit L